MIRGRAGKGRIVEVAYALFLESLLLFLLLFSSLISLCLLLINSLVDLDGLARILLFTFLVVGICTPCLVYLFSIVLPFPVLLADVDTLASSAGFKLLLSALQLTRFCVTFPSALPPLASTHSFAAPAASSTHSLLDIFLFLRCYRQLHY